VYRVKEFGEYTIFVGRGGLRERKKAETRQHLSDVATRLFLERGFDEVSVAEVAVAANVSKMTVFNYFPRKEDLLFDRGPEALALVTAAVRNRGPGETPLEALHRLVRELQERDHPLASLNPGLARFWGVVLDSPALRARLREVVEEAQDALAALFAEATGAGPDDLRPRLTAALLVSAYRTAYAHSLRRLMAGEPAGAVNLEHARLVDDVFAAVARAMP
jgi:AcrR family transcriptional regulator